MPKDQWKKANDRAKYGPLRYEKKKKTHKKVKSNKKQRHPRNFGHRKEPLYVVYAGTPIRVIKPNGAVVEMKARKNLRFGRQTQEFREDNHYTFKRYGYYLIVKQELTGRQSAGP